VILEVFKSPEVRFFFKNRNISFVFSFHCVIARNNRGMVLIICASFLFYSQNEVILEVFKSPKVRKKKIKIAGFLYLVFTVL